MNKELLESKYNLTEEEFVAVNNRLRDFIKLEKKGLISPRCNCKQDSNIKYFKKTLHSKIKADRCIKFLERQGGYCNCEIMFNVVPHFDQIKKEINFNEVDYE